jgi:RecB family exonuclease
MGIKNFAPYRLSTYQWQPGHEKRLRITKSSLTSDFDFCPKQYEYSRVDGRKSPQTDDMTRGTNVHDAMEEYFVAVRPNVSKILAKAKAGDEEEALGLMLKCLPEPKAPYTLEEEDILQTRLEWEYARLLACDGENYLPIMNEDEIHAYFDYKTEVNGKEYTIPIHMAGAIDRGFETEEGGVVLMELKTGKYPTEGSKGHTRKVQDMRYEMMFYMELLRKADHPHKGVTHWGWLYPAGDRLGLPDTEKNWTYEPIKRHVTAYRKKVYRGFDNLIEAYILDHFPPDPFERKCAWCDFRRECPAWSEDAVGKRFWDLYEEVNGRVK